MITPEDRKNVRDQLILLVGDELGKYSRSPLPDLPAIFIGKTTPPGYKMILSKQTDKVVLPGLELVLYPHQEYAKVPRNIQSRSTPDVWRLHVIYHDNRQNIENSLPIIVDNYSVPPKDILRLPADKTRNIPEQYRLDLVWIAR